MTSGKILPLCGQKQFLLTLRQGDSTQKWDVVSQPLWQCNYLINWSCVFATPHMEQIHNKSSGWISGFSKWFGIKHVPQCVSNILSWACPCISGCDFIYVSTAGLLVVQICIGIKQYDYQVKIWLCFKSYFQTYTYICVHWWALVVKILGCFIFLVAVLTLIIVVTACNVQWKLWCFQVNFIRGPVNQYQYPGLYEKRQGQ